MKINCANPGCTNTVGSLSVKLGFPGSGESRDGMWFCSHKCYSSFAADNYIEEKRCGMGKAVRRLKLGMLLLKNNFIEPEQLRTALQEKNAAGSLKKLGEILVEAGHITQKELKSVLSMQAGVAPINLDTNLKIRLKDLLPLKIVETFHFVVFNLDEENKTLFIAVYDMDYITCLEDYFIKIFPGYLVKFYLEDREKILTILTKNYPGKTFSVPVAGDKKALWDPRKHELEQQVMECVDFMSAFTNGGEIKLDNLEDAIWLKGKRGDLAIDIYLTPKKSVSVSR